MAVRARRGAGVEAAREAHTHHVHVFAEGHPEIARSVAFRDYLRTNPEAARAYAELKRALAARYRYDSAAYTEAKTAFVMDILGRAGPV